MKKMLALALSLAVFALGAFVSCKENAEDNGEIEAAADIGAAEEAYELGLMNGLEDTVNHSENFLSVIEGIAMAANLNARHNGVDISERAVNDTELRFDFDDDSLVDSSGGRNARQKVGMTFGRCSGTFADGILTVTAGEPNSGGAYDPQIGFNKFNIDSRDFDTLTARMRVKERLPEVVEGKAKSTVIQFYFATSTSPGYDGKKILRANFGDVEDETQWFDITLDLSSNEYWKDEITNFRFDPPENNGVYELDYIVLSKNKENKTEQWYDKYIDYAIENGIVNESSYYEDDFGRNITVAELCNLLAAALPEQSYAPINNIKGIPDVQRDAVNADAYLMLYKAGVLLGFDEKGSLEGDAQITVDDAAGIFVRAALPEKRINGELAADWSEQGNEYDLEFNDENIPENLSFDAKTAKVIDGALVVEACDKGEGSASRHDTKIIVSNVNLRASDYVKLRIRYKAEMLDEGGNNNYDFYFATKSEPQFSENKSDHANLFASSKKDAAGWYILDIDLAILEKWNGRVTSFRFDPTNANGIFTIDYIRFIEADPLLDASHKKMLEAGYVATGLLRDPDFERGFYIAINDNSLGKPAKDHGIWQDYCETDEAPVWTIGPYFSRVDLATNRDMTTDKYTFTDTEGINTVKYDPEQKSITLRLNGVANYQGKPHIDGESALGWWPHLLLTQMNTKMTEEERKINGADADRVFMEIDVRVLDFKKTINPEGHNSLTFPIFFYLMCDDAPNAKIWFSGGGIIHNNPSSKLKPAWTTDSAAHQYIYGTTMADLYDGMENSYNPVQGVYLSGKDWKHLRIDLTPHIERCIEWANRDNAYGVKVSKENLYFAGGNIGFEIFGNYDATVEFKNFNLISYRKQG